MRIEEMSKEQLLKIVASLPRTADGMPIIVGMKLWLRSPTVHQVSVTELSCGDVQIYDQSRTDGKYYVGCAPSNLYSTSDAAYKARHAYEENRRKRALDEAQRTVKRLTPGGE